MPELIIDNKQTIAGIQMQFNKLFPYLRLEFFRQAPKAGIGNAKNGMIGTDMKIKDLQHIHKTGEIWLTSTVTVSQLEKLFATEYGLYVQVFRKSGKIWLETTATDNWTLEQQNEEGRSLQQHLKIDRENTDDHDVY